eukprot:XP_016656875.1 PREDICTED: uncharacterized protein LOC107882683 [Acyrthosiphon pisum]
MNKYQLMLKWYQMMIILLVFSTFHHYALLNIEEVKQNAPVFGHIMLLLNCLAGVQRPLPEPYNIGALNYVCAYCKALHFRCDQTTPNHLSTCCNDGLMAVSGPCVLTTAIYYRGCRLKIRWKADTTEITSPGKTTLWILLRSPPTSTHHDC